MSIVSSNGNNLEYYPFNTQVLDSVDNSERLLACNHQAYLCTNDTLYEFTLNDPSNLTGICYEEYNILSIGGTWTNSRNILACSYTGSQLYEIYPETCEMSNIGGGSNGITGLSMDLTTGELYGIKGSSSDSDLYKIDPETGEQEFIGSCGVNWIIGIAFDSDGVLYGWSISPDNLYTIDIETGEAKEVGSFGINLNDASDGHICMEDDILYLAANTYTGCYLYECDKETADLTLVGELDVDEIYFLVVPDWNLLPIAKFNWTPTLPNPGETILFNASDSYDPDGYIKLYEWDWNNDGVYDYKNYTSPIATHIFEEAGKYLVTLRVHDNNRTNDIKKKRVRVGYQPPDAPIIDGPTIGRAGVVYQYNFSLYDLDDDAMYLRVDWGSGTPGTWTGPYKSGRIVGLKHGWNQKGTFAIRAQAKDIYNVESLWGELRVTIPRTRATSYHWFLERFPLLERLLGLIK
jgi:hypothetical protein